MRAKWKIIFAMGIFFEILALIFILLKITVLVYVYIVISILIGFVSLKKSGRDKSALDMILIILAMLLLVYSVYFHLM